MQELKPNTEYFERKMSVVLRDLKDYTSDELWREVNRILSGATGLESAEALQKRVEELESGVRSISGKLAVKASGIDDDDLRDEVIYLAQELNELWQAGS